ncbi:hypothetical protein IGI37_003137 [Enterococcus sp. AZ194]|uniref:hypothetical protein n=1 Tax=Enterococcus sp. AZ194 TaxID=2774629 RepID=UPI003F1ED755
MTVLSIDSKNQYVTLEETEVTDGVRSYFDQTEKNKKKKERLFTRGELAKIVKQESQKIADKALLQSENQAHEQLKQILIKEQQKNSHNESTIEVMQILLKYELPYSQAFIQYIVSEDKKKTLENMMIIVDYILEVKERIQMQKQ